MVEDKVDEEVFVADEDAFLPGLESKAVAQLEEKILETIQQGVCQVGFGLDVA